MPFGADQGRAVVPGLRASGMGVSAAQQTASEVTRSGALAASQMPVMPPSETPAYANRSMP